jgi:nucleotide-binding universal stress UspA family protein
VGDTIVCGVDASDAAIPVCEAARRIATALGDRLVVVHVVDEPAEEAQELLASLGARMDGAEVRLVEGEPAEAVLQAAAEEDADLLVLGSRGRSPLRQGLLGSVVRDVTGASRAPVMVVPPDASPHPLDAPGASVVCGVDGSEHSLAAARLAARLARELGQRLVIVHALMDAKATAAYLGASRTNPPITGQPDVRDQLGAEIVDAAVRAAGADATGVMEAGAPWDVLESVADRESGALLVIAVRGIGGMRAALLGSVASRLTTMATRPVVLVPEGALEGLSPS